MSDRNILHCFADEGIESEALAAYGSVTRVGLDPKDNPYTDEVIACDVREWEPEQEFDLGLFHPPCQKWAATTHIHGDRSEHANLIPLARKIGKKHCDKYIIENVPNAPLQKPVLLNGRMFGLPLQYERAFEMNYHVEQIPIQEQLTERAEFTKHQDGAGWNGSATLWKSVKGYTGEYNAQSLKREAIPRAYINYLVRPLL